MLYRNVGDRFVDVTEKAAVGHPGWGQGVCVGDYDNDGWTDLYVTHYGYNLLFRNRGAKLSKNAVERPVSLVKAPAGARVALFWITTVTAT